MARTAEEFLRDYVDKSRGPDACWPYLGARNKAGYGVINADNWPRPAHRFVLEQHLDQPLGALLACHHCDNPACCNPAHLYAGTAKDNAADKVRRRRSRGARHPMLDALPPCRPIRKRGELPRTTPVEIATALDRVVRELRSDPDSVEAWEEIAITLQKAINAARKHRLAREEREEMRQNSDETRAEKKSASG